MYLRIVTESFRRRARTKLAVLAAVALGAGAASGLVMILLGVGDAMAGELRRLDANIEIVPKDRPLTERSVEVLGAETVRWRNQKLSAVPELRLERSGYVLVGREPDASWRIDGDPGVLAGVSLGLPQGAVLDLGRRLTVTGTVATGGEEDSQVLVPLRVAQEIAGTPGAVSRVLVSARVTPETEAYKLFRTRARTFSDREIEQMMCTPFPHNVAREFGEAMEAEGRVIHRVAETEGAILRKIESIVWILAAAAVLAACLSVFAAMTASVVERRKEVGVLKALGATHGAVAALFLGEAALIGLLGSALGYAIGLASAKSMSAALFGHSVPGSAGVYLVTLAAALLIVALGAAWPLRRVVRLDPHAVLHEV